LPPGINPGQRSHLSALDIKRLQKAYPCGSKPVKGGGGGGSGGGGSHKKKKKKQW